MIAFILYVVLRVMHVDGVVGMHVNGVVGMHVNGVVGVHVDDAVAREKRGGGVMH